MTVGVGALCFACQHWQGGTCTAFPDGIPDAIFFDGDDHREPVDGDGGVVFKLRDGGQDDLDQWERLHNLVYQVTPPSESSDEPGP